MNGPTFAASALSRRHVLQQLGEDPWRSRRRHCCGWLASCRSINRAHAIGDREQQRGSICVVDAVLLLRGDGSVGAIGELSKLIGVASSEQVTGLTAELVCAM